MKHYRQITSADSAGDARTPGCVLFLDLAGPIRLSDVDGSDLTPNLRKAQGLLALIATAPGLRRSRTWVQDKLWSDRGRAQGAASLRQCLHRLRAAMGRYADCLTTGSSWIALDPARVKVSTGLHAGDVGGSVEFLEGLDIGDPEFEDWLRDQRTFYAERPSRASTIASDGHVAGLRSLQSELAGICDREDFGAMLAAAALAGYLLQGRDRAQSGRRLGPEALIDALRGGHAADAREIVGAFSTLIDAHRREACERSPGSAAVQQRLAPALAQ